MRRSSLAWIALAAVLAAASFWGGRALRGGGQAASAFDLKAEPYQASQPRPAETTAGFTGFAPGGPFEGSPVVTGRVKAVTGDGLTVETSSGDSLVQIGSDQKLRRVDAADAGAIVPGATVIVLTDAARTTARAVLVVLAP